MTERTGWRVGALVQARMGSRRFPGKMLHVVHGRPILQYVLERLQHCDGLACIVVATSTEPHDNAIAAFCRSAGVACVRGAEHDVAGRFTDALSEHAMDAFVRVCGDRPLLDQALVGRGIDLFRLGGDDLVTNVHPASFPPGQTVEVVGRDVFSSAYPLMTAGEDRVHVTRYFYQHADDYRIQNFSTDVDWSDVRLAVDTDHDAAVLAAMLAQMTSEHWTYGLADVGRLYRAVARQTK